MCHNSTTIEVFSVFDPPEEDSWLMYESCLCGTVIQTEMFPSVMMRAEDTKIRDDSIQHILLELNSKSLKKTTKSTNKSALLTRLEIIKLKAARSFSSGCCDESLWEKI